MTIKDKIELIKVSRIFQKCPYDFKYKYGKWECNWYDETVGSITIDLTSTVIKAEFHETIFFVKGHGGVRCIASEGSSYVGQSLEDFLVDLIPRYRKGAKTIKQ